MKIIKKICLMFVFILIIFFALAFSESFIMYKSVDICYLGSAKGVWDSNFYFAPENCMENDFLYYNMGYAVLDDNTVNRCCMNEFDFQFEKKDGKIYVYSYGFPLLKLLCNKTRISKQGKYHNKAIFSKDMFRDGVYYFYEMDPVSIGDWMGDPYIDFNYFVEEEDRDDIQEMLGVLIIVFFLMCCLNMDVLLQRLCFFAVILILLYSLFH